MLNDRLYLFNWMTRNQVTSLKGLKMHPSNVRHAYKLKEISGIELTRSELRPADTLTTDGANNV